MIDRELVEWYGYPEYPGHPITILVHALKAFDSPEEAMEKSEHGPPAMVAHPDVPGAGGNAYQAYSLLDDILVKIREEDVDNILYMDLHDIIIGAHEYWVEVADPEHHDVSYGIAQANNMVGELQELLEEKL